MLKTINIIGTAGFCPSLAKIRLTRIRLIRGLLCVYMYIYISGVARCQKVCVCGGGGGGGGGAHRHVIYIPSVKNQYERVVFGCMVI